MSRKTKTKENKDIIDDSIINEYVFDSGDNEDVEETSAQDRGGDRSSRQKRRKIYERVRTTDIPNYVRQHFLKNDYDVRWIRWSVHGEPDFRYLAMKEQEGYEFVHKDEVPKEYLRTLRVKDSSITTGLLTNGYDLCLMKIDVDLKKSRKEHFENETKYQLDSVNMNVKRGGIINNSRTRTTYREPTFQG